MKKRTYIKDTPARKNMQTRDCLDGIVNLPDMFPDMSAETVPDIFFPGTLAATFSGRRRIWSTEYSNGISFTVRI